MDSPAVENTASFDELLDSVKYCETSMCDGGTLEFFFDGVDSDTINELTCAAPPVLTDEGKQQQTTAPHYFGNNPNAPCQNVVYNSPYNQNVFNTFYTHSAPVQDNTYTNNFHNQYSYNYPQFPPVFPPQGHFTPAYTIEGSSPSLAINVDDDEVVEIPAATTASLPSRGEKEAAVPNMNRVYSSWEPKAQMPGYIPKKGPVWGYQQKRDQQKRERRANKEKVRKKAADEKAMNEKAAEQDEGPFVSRAVDLALAVDVENQRAKRTKEAA
ncbi:hypothetical protein BU16DRAFT_556930 [Lophium mytilinum]|uniref:Uncharacterized protein n=1 Tax=Lophium mytilinum TaxID=390894 RepID=A0A6A6R9Q1_9PEZI|nr:hypothetical protein BU16DRAFT_556930 [Lophium mytilinum]